MGNLHSHVDLSGIPGVIPLPKKNGRVVCHFEPDVSKVSKALASFMGASKRPVAAPVRRLPGDSQAVQATASQATPSDVRVGTIEDLTAGLSQVGSYSDDEAEEALQALTRG
jgi:hypothetical protein